jgi:hypothetical protein
MIACPDRSQFELLLAKQLDDTARDDVEIHVENCDDCQQVLEQITASKPIGVSSFYRRKKQLTPITGTIDVSFPVRWSSEEAVREAGRVEVESYDLPAVVDPRGEREGPRVWIVESGVLTTPQQVAVGDVVGVGIPSHDLAMVVDMGGLVDVRETRPRNIGGAGRVDGGELPAAQQEAVLDVVCVDVETDDLPTVVDVHGVGAREKARIEIGYSSSVWVVKTRVLAVVHQKTVGNIVGVPIIAGNLSAGVDPEGEGALDAVR